jgi:cation diffusion facilitator family transporter
MASGSKKVIFAALAGNSLIAVTKFAAASFTGSSAMLSEGIHSLVDTGNQALLLFGLRRAARPPDAEFPLGHGKEIYFWSFVVAILIFALGGGISIYEGFHSVLDPQPVTSPVVNYVVLVLAMLFEGGAWFFAWKEFQAVRGRRGLVEAVQRGKDPTLFVVLFEDSAAMAGLLVALLGLAGSQLTGWHWLDGAAAIGIGLILCGAAAWLAFETHGLLIGESAGPEVTETIRRIAASEAGVDHVNEVVTLHMGPEFILVNLSVDFEDTLPAGDVEAAVVRMDRRVKEAVPEVRRVFIEAEAPGDPAAHSHTKPPER